MAEAGDASSDAADESIAGALGHSKPTQRGRENQLVNNYIPLAEANGDGREPRKHTAGPVRRMTSRSFEVFPWELHRLRDHGRDQSRLAGGSTRTCRIHHWLPKSKAEWGQRVGRCDERHIRAGALPISSFRAISNENRDRPAEPNEIKRALQHLIGSFPNSSKREDLSIYAITLFDDVNPSIATLNETCRRLRRSCEFLPSIKAAPSVNASARSGRALPIHNGTFDAVCQYLRRRRPRLAEHSRSRPQTQPNFVARKRAMFGQHDDVDHSE
ncbi:hypothetical protein [Bradyrhizobium sp. UFLA05-153]